MAFEPLIWYCQPLTNTAWTEVVDDGAFGVYTPCAINTLVISTSHLVLLGLCCYRTWLIKKNSKVQRFSLTSKCYNHMLGFLSGYCTIHPLLRLFMGISIFNLNIEAALAPYEVSMFKQVGSHVLISLKGARRQACGISRLLTDNQNGSAMCSTRA